MFNIIPYSSLNAKQQENYNFHKVASRLADYGFNSLRLTDDWQGADFIACHIDGETFLKVQLKGRLVVARKYLGKGIFIAFIHGDSMFLYDHDRLADHLEHSNLIGADSKGWHEKGSRSWPTPPSWARKFLEEFRI